MITYNQDYYHMVNGICHPAGYSNYDRIPSRNVDDPDDQGEVFKTQHYKLAQAYPEIFVGKSVLEIGCAKGFFVEDARSWNIDCVGIDGSEFAISHANQWCSLQDARTYLPQLPDNAFDTIVGLRFMPCLSDAEIAEILPHIHRVAQNRFFLVDHTDYYQNPNQLITARAFYNVKPIEDWRQILQDCIVKSVTEMNWQS